MTLVTPLVKPESPPITPAENEETLLTTEAANEEPGMVGMDTVGRPTVGPTDGAETVVVPLPAPPKVLAGRGTVGS